MKQDCAFDLEALPYEKSEIDRLPTKYRTSVLRSHNKQTASGSEVLTIELKNSVAFGQPLSALTIESNEGYGYVKMKFPPNADVPKLLPYLQHRSIDNAEYWQQARYRIFVSKEHTAH